MPRSEITQSLLKTRTRRELRFIRSVPLCQFGCQAARLLGTLLLVLLVGAQCQTSESGINRLGGQTATRPVLPPASALPRPGRRISAVSAGGALFRNTVRGVPYVGSQVCAECHSQIFKQYEGTPHGQAASLPGQRPELRDLSPDGRTICEKEADLCFRVFRQDNSYYMSEFQPGSAGQELFRETEKIEYVLGAPMAGTGYVIGRGNYLFEAPLSYYSGSQDIHPEGWGLSPGYKTNPLGFARPLIGACLYCHVGRLRPTADASNQYREPPFGELAIGCESCHGPGGLHVQERQKRLPISGAIDSSIVNPAMISPRLADDTCNACHELGEARIPQPGKSFVDFRPGTPLLDTAAIFKSRLIMGWNMEEWFDEMTLSKCYRATGGRLSCISCHNPHFRPTAEEAPAYFRSKCMACHRENSCSAPMEKRMRTSPADNCIGCHMPKHVAPSFVMLGTNGTSHRIAAYEGEPPPATGIPQADPTTGLILVDRRPGPNGTRVPPLVLLQAYDSILARHPDRSDLKQRYDVLLDRLGRSTPSNVIVLSALARRELEKPSAEGYFPALSYLERAANLGSQSPQDYILLSTIQYKLGETNEAIKVLRKAISLFPYIPASYENLSFLYLATGDEVNAGEVAKEGLSVFPGDPDLRTVRQKVTADR